MIVVKLELWPKGDELKARELGRMVASNVGGTEKLGEYFVDLYGRQKRHMGCAKVSRWPRTRYHAWYLVARMLEALGRCIDQGQITVGPGQKP